MLELLRKSFLESLVVERNGYPYFINPISDGIPLTDPALLDEVLNGLLRICRFDCDVILAPEAMGIPLAAGISMKTGIPYSVIRKRSYGIPGELEVVRDTGYSHDCVYINGVAEGDRVVIVDDTLSTGGTMRAITSMLISKGIDVTEVAVVFDKAEDLSAAVPWIDVKALLKVGI